MLSASITSFLIASCVSSPNEPVEPGRVVVETVKPILPPEEYLDPCESPRVSRRVEDELRRLALVVDCERADKAALRRWADESRTSTPES